MIAAVNDGAVFPANGRSPAAISCKITPRAHTSDRASADAPARTSGAMYAGVPTTTPGWVIACATVAESGLLSERLASPKSSTFA